MKDGVVGMIWRYGCGFLNADNYRIVKGYSRIIIIRCVGSAGTGQLSEIDFPNRKRKKISGYRE